MSKVPAKSAKPAAPEVSVVVNLHREGMLCQPTLASVDEAVARAASEGIPAEVTYVLDRPDGETVDAVRQHLGMAPDADVEAHAFPGGTGCVVLADVGELAGARNLGAGLSRGHFITFIDGDDLWGDEWITRCHALAARSGRDDVVIHPQNNLYFGRGVDPYFWVHPDMRHDRIDLDAITVANRWTALSFYPRSLNARFPYRPNAFKEGFGYEDWMWHFETIRAGVLHVTAEGTVHMIRRKQSGSLLKATSSAALIPRFNAALAA